MFREITVKICNSVPFILMLNRPKPIFFFEIWHINQFSFTVKKKMLTIRDSIIVTLNHLPIEQQFSSQHLNHFSVKLYEIWKNVIIQNFLLQKDLQIWIGTFFYKIYIFFLNLKKYYWKSKFMFFTIICEIRKKHKNKKLFTSIRSTNFVWYSFW